MKRFLLLAALAAFGQVGCKGSDSDRHVRSDMPMLGADGKAATSSGNVVQTAYRPTAGAGVQQAGGTMVPGAPSSVVQAVGTAATCPNGTCPNGTCRTSQMPMTPPDQFTNQPVR